MPPPPVQQAPPPVAPAPPLPPPEPPKAPDAPELARQAEARRFTSGPREWNIWELEKLMTGASVDPARKEEQELMLMHLREYANAQGTLPQNFDSLVRDTFGELIE